MTSLTRRAALSLAGATALGGCLGIGGGSDVVPDGPPPDGPVANAPLPADPSAHTYARMGDAEATVTYYGNWKCPFCASFSTGSDDRALGLPTIVTDYVEPGDLSLRYRALAYGPNGEPFLGPDAPRAARAGLAVWNVDPGAYWTFHEFVMANQPSESERWATTDTLVDFAEGAGVSDPDAVRTAIEEGRYAAPVQQTAQRAYRVGVQGTPSLVYDGKVVSPFERGATRDLLERAASA